MKIAEIERDIGRNKHSAARVLPTLAFDSGADDWIAAKACE